MEKNIMTIDEVCEALGLGVRSVQMLQKMGKLPKTINSNTPRKVFEKTPELIEAIEKLKAERR